MRRIRLAGQLAEPISHYTDGVEAGGFVYVSGMLPLDANGDVVGAGDVADRPAVNTVRRRYFGDARRACW
jgi:enamine deaminase RidA (YjgF/YER057c/UK114 family)